MLVIAVAVAGVAGTLDMLRLAANRLVVGTPVGAEIFGQSGWLIAGLSLLGGGFLGARSSRPAALAALVTFCAALMLLSLTLCTAASDLIAWQPPAARARLASGAWTALVLLTAATIWAAGRTGLRRAGWFTAAGLTTAVLLVYRSGAYDGLSLAVEYRARAAAVQAALVQHVALSAAAVVLAAMSCALLYLWRAGRGAIKIAINGLQVVPAVALLGGLVALVSGVLAAIPGLRAVGLSALGAGPAILAIAAYLLLPFWRGLEGALRAAEPESVDAATAIGLTPRQILLELRLPIGTPILVGALRVASVQAIGLATLGALVGAGGLGGIVFDGMAQFAPDLILLGALPVIGLSLVVERGLSVVEDWARRSQRG
ncbi:ABC transporter permease subunit [Methylobacterium gnaphalii]|uniref:ABC transporter permease n=1 Tax=Methylobacterium gnaphalii TaxID=1010610 RepID=A0A512JJJ2_9HYPH|nr:ABC transporter permease subunit [Methylobacterium gnaphalii]GEP10127.1 ABC transporter permease [Methylobacterium gnaphalii]GLS48397.1 ABC transporter permease [Methylobacterium gnaphalii]